MSTDMAARFAFFSRDGNLDLEDVAQAVAQATEDGRLHQDEANEIRAALTRHADSLDPGATLYLQDLLKHKITRLVNRVLLAPHPRGEQRDLYYARTDVVALQERLTQVGHPTLVDGDFGPGTGRSLAAFQHMVRLPPSGVLDGRTLFQLNRRLEALGHEPMDLNTRARVRPDAVIAVKAAADHELSTQLQEALRAVGRHHGLDSADVKVDGDFGPATERALAEVQRALYLPDTGILDTSTARAMNLLLHALRRSPLPEVPPPGGSGFDGGVQLHFYPGDHEFKMYVLRGGELLDTYGMVGGAEGERPDPDNPKVDFSPTREGEYEVVRVSPHASHSWAYSYVPYGSHLREVEGEIQYRDGSGVWRWATGPSGEFLDREPAPLTARRYFNRDRELPPAWTRSEFGHLRALLKDVADGRIQGHMIHSSPYSELTKNYYVDTEAFDEPSAALSHLRRSHGCEHLHPKDFDEIVSKGYLEPGTRFIVHGYDESFGEFGAA